MTLAHQTHKALVALALAAASYRPAQAGPGTNFPHWVGQARRVGKPSPAGTKLARKALKHKIGLGHPR